MVPIYIEIIIKRNHIEVATKENLYAEAIRGSVNWLIEGPDVKFG